jgi:molecular chaperone Hsp33
VTDTLTPFVFEHAALRGALVDLGPAARSVLACNTYPPALQRALAELLAAAALLASTLKFEGRLSMQLQGDGPVRLLVVECTDTLALRAAAQWDEARVGALADHASLADLAGGPEHGRFVLTLDPQRGGTLYQGIVTLEGDSVAELIEHYLATSEQLASRMLLAVDGVSVSGLIVQRLPGATEEDSVTWARIGGQLDARAAAALSAGSVEDRLRNLFPEDDLRVFAARPVEERCSCSRERVANALRIAGAAEIESILAERGDVLVTCEFCNSDYTFAPEEARALFDAPAATRH